MNHPVDIIRKTCSITSATASSPPKSASGSTRTPRSALHARSCNPPRATSNRKEKAFRATPRSSAASAASRSRRRHPRRSEVGPSQRVRALAARRTRRAWAIAGVLMFAATGATASFWSVRHAIVSRLLVNTPSQAPLPAPEPKEAPAPEAR